MPLAFGLVGIGMGFLLRTIRGAARDKSTVIFVLFGFTVLFWMAFEQQGNALNLWADFHTDLHVGSWDYPAEYWQFVNPLFIVALGPLFSILWVWLASKNREPSTPVKMVAAMVLIAASFGAMVAAAQAENHTVTTIALEALPEGASLETLDGGRLHFDAARRELTVRGVLPPFVVTSALEAVASRRTANSSPGCPMPMPRPKGAFFGIDPPGLRASARRALDQERPGSRRGDLALDQLFFCDPRRTVPLSRRALDGHQAGPHPVRLALDGGLDARQLGGAVRGDPRRELGQNCTYQLFHYIRLDLMCRRIGAGTAGAPSQAAHARRRALGILCCCADLKTRGRAHPSPIPAKIALRFPSERSYHRCNGETRKSARTCGHECRVPVFR